MRLSKLLPFPRFLLQFFFLARSNRDPDSSRLEKYPISEDAMLRALSILILLPFTACTGTNERLTREYQIGEELMIDCRDNGKRCSEYLDFKKRFEESVNNITTFENSLAVHKARVAKGGAV